MKGPDSLERLFYCRAGFEPELAQEVQHVAADAGFSAVAKTDRDTAIVRLATDAPLDFSVRRLIFARQSLTLVAALPKLDPKDRLTPLLDALGDRGPWCDVWVETPDTGGADALAPLVRSFETVLVAALKKRQLLDKNGNTRLHVCVRSGTDFLIAEADTRTASPWRGGIPRLKFPREAPSRSTLKLEEAFLVLLDEREREAWLKPGMTAVDLGASPGGWTYQLVRRSMRVVAVDNGPMDERLMQSGLVDHRRADGFRFRPAKPVDWVVCDMVEQPIRVAALMRDWLAEGAARRALFNLKLPMKKRWLEVQRSLVTLSQAFDETLNIRAKQLYHDREEITLLATR